MASSTAILVPTGVTYSPRAPWWYFTSPVASESSGLGIVSRSAADSNSASSSS